MCIGNSLCYAEVDTITDYLNRPEIRQLLGVESPKNFSSCDDRVYDGFTAHMDKWAVPAQHYVASLLERGVRIMIYAGTYDWRCNWVANKLWVDKLDWSGRDAYAAESWKEWTVEGAVAGETKTSGLLTFVTVRGAGHMGEYRELR